jgi:hypothetical protein
MDFEVNRQGTRQGTGPLLVRMCRWDAYLYLYLWSTTLFIPPLLNFWCCVILDLILCELSPNFWVLFSISRFRGWLSIELINTVLSTIKLIYLWKIRKQKSFVWLKELTNSHHSLFKYTSFVMLRSSKKFIILLLFIVCCLLFVVCFSLNMIVVGWIFAQARWSYLPHEILWGHRFVDCISKDRRGKFQIDFNKISCS